MTEKTNLNTEIEKALDGLKDDSMDALAGILALSLILSSAVKDKEPKKEEPKNAAPKAKEEKPTIDAKAYEKEKALTNELIEKDRLIKTLYDTISRQDKQIADLKEEVKTLRLMTAPTIISKDDVEKDEIRKQIEDLKRELTNIRNTQTPSYPYWDPFDTRRPYWADKVWCSANPDDGFNLFASGSSM